MHGSLKKVYLVFYLTFLGILHNRKDNKFVKNYKIYHFPIVYHFYFPIAQNK